MYLQLMSVTTREGLSCKRAPTADASHKSQLVIGASDQLAVNSEGFHNSVLSFKFSLEQLIELRKALYLL